MTDCCDSEIDTRALAARQRRVLLVVTALNIATFLMMMTNLLRAVRSPPSPRRPKSD